MNETLMTATLEAVRQKLKKIDYGRIIIIKNGKNKIDIEEVNRERIESNKNNEYHKG